MFDRVVMKVIEVSPDVPFVTHARIPVAIPYLTTKTALSPVHMQRGNGMQTLHQLCQVLADTSFDQDVVMIVQDDPGVTAKIVFGNEFLHLLE